MIDFFIIFLMLIDFLPVFYDFRLAVIKFNYDCDEWLDENKGNSINVFNRPQVPLGPPWFDFVPSTLDEWRIFKNINYLIKKFTEKLIL